MPRKAKSHTRRVSAASTSTDNEWSDNSRHRTTVPASSPRRLKARESLEMQYSRYIKKQNSRRNNPAVSLRLGSAIHANTSDGGAVVAPESRAPQVKMKLPKYLGRPVLREVSRAAIIAADPDLATVPLPFIDGLLEDFTPDMLRASNSVEIDPPEDTVDLPREMPSIVKDQCAEFPTHMLAVSSLETPPRVLVYPVHHIILATSCANLPVVRKTEPRTPSPAGEISIPVLGIKIPCPETFGLLNIFLYKKDTLWLLGMLLPTRNATPAGLLAFDIEADAKELFEFRVMLRQTFSDHVLAKYMKTVNGLWRNAVALGVCNDEFWDVLDLAWNILLGAATQ